MVSQAREFKMSRMLAWVDTETTGLDTTTDHLLEVAVVFAKSPSGEQLNTYRAVVHYDADRVREMREASDPVVQKMHDRTGLWDRLSTSEATALTQVDRDLATLAAQTRGDGERLVLAGNSVHYDFYMMARCLPEFSKQLDHHILDVSVLALVAKEKFGIPLMPKTKNHSAYEDIIESMEEYDYLTARLTSR